MLIPVATENRLSQLSKLEMKPDHRRLKFLRVGRHFGIVKLTGFELADQKRSRLSRGELTPFSERGSAVLFENISAVEVTVVIEMVVDRGMGGGKFLEGLYVPEPCHRPLSSTERLV